jgi:hypothetical protein
MPDRLIAMFSDIHGNHHALQCCLADARAQARKLGLPLSFWCLGDVANGLAGVRECMSLLADLRDDLHEWLIGNHDLAQLLWWPIHDQAPLPATPSNRQAVKQQVVGYVRTEEDIELLADDVPFLEDIRQHQPELWRRWVTAPTWTYCRDVAGVTLAHGLVVDLAHDQPYNTTIGLLDPNLIELLSRMISILGQTAEGAPRLVVTGHTHLATVWMRSSADEWESRSVDDHSAYQFGDTWYELDRDAIWVVNVGSVGWQKDGRLRGAWVGSTVVYALLHVSDDQRLSICFRRPTYDLEAALEDYVERGTPERIIKRVRAGE